MSLEWFSWCCHGNSVWGLWRGNVCGIQLLWGGEILHFTQTKFPLWGRDIRIKMWAGGGTDMVLDHSSETMTGNRFKPHFCHWSPNLKLSTKFKIKCLLACFYLLCFYFSTLWYCEPDCFEKGAASPDCSFCTQGRAFSDVHCVCQVLDKIVGYHFSTRRVLHLLHGDKIQVWLLCFAVIKAWISEDFHSNINSISWLQLRDKNDSWFLLFPPTPFSFLLLLVSVKVTMIPTIVLYMIHITLTFLL